MNLLALDFRNMENSLSLKRMKVYKDASVIDGCFDEEFKDWRIMNSAIEALKFLTYTLYEMIPLKVVQIENFYFDESSLEILRTGKTY